MSRRKRIPALYRTAVGSPLAVPQIMVGLAAPLPAQNANREDGARRDLTELTPEQLVNLEVTTAFRKPETRLRSPAAVSVILEINDTPTVPPVEPLPPVHRAYRPDIDGLRAIAVLAVVGYHAFPSLVSGGFVGVDVFFVISGFLISGILMQSLDHGSFSFREFYSRRIRRIFPALSVVLFACYVYGWVVLLPRECKQLGGHVAAGAGFVSNLVLWGESGYFDRAAETKPLLHLWSLGIEEQFYIAWPLLLWGLWKTPFNPLVWCGVLTVLSFALNISIVHGDAVAAFYSPATRLWELLIGSCLARISMRPSSPAASEHSRFGRGDIQSALGFACICAAILLVRKEYAFPGWWALLPTIGTYLVISAGPTAWINRFVLAHPILVWVGMISYPLYLWHWPLLSFTRQSEVTPPSVETRMLALLASVACAWLTYAFIERPVRFGASGNKVAVLCGVMGAVGAVGFLTYVQGGQVFRYPVGLRSLLKTYDFRVDGRLHECWVTNSNAYEEFASSCADRSPKDAAVVLWGDSHAARLYPGLKNVAQEHMAISEFARDGCPPIIGYGTPTCIRSNSYVMERIEQLHPKAVLMLASWVSYDTGLDANEYPSRHLVATIDELKRRGVRNIVILGPAPVWNEDLPTLLYKRVFTDAPLYRVPERMSSGFNRHAMEVDERLKAILAHQESTHYVSLIECLCNSEGCLARVPQSSDLTTWDRGHLTTAAAELVARYLLEKKVL
jgi:peptidoglycan/LPS O-acetylase OafA/YrhL